MDKEAMGEILGAVFNGEAILCETSEQRNEIIEACWNSWIHLSMLTRTLIGNDHSLLVHSPDEYLCLVLIDDYLCSYRKTSVPDFINTLVPISSFFTSPHSDSSDFDDRFTLLIGQETG